MYRITLSPGNVVTCGLEETVLTAILRSGARVMFGYVAETADRARSEPEESTIRSYRRLAENFRASVGEAGTTTGEERVERAEGLSRVTYDELLRDRLAYGPPDMVVERLAELRQQLVLSGVVMEPHVGGRVPLEQVLRSIRLFANEVAPRLR